MKLLFISILLGIFLLTCKRNDNYVAIENLKDLANQQFSINEHIYLTVKKNVEDEGRKPNEVEIMEKASSIIKNRDVNFAKMDFKNHLKFIKSEYSAIDIKFPDKIKRSEMLYSNYQKSKDSVSYYQFILSVLLIEKDILSSYNSKIGSSCGFSLKAHILKNQDTVDLNKRYSFFVYPEYYAMNGVLQIDTNIHVLCDGEKINLKLGKREIGGLLAVELCPPQKGLYQITGNVQYTRFWNKNEMHTVKLEYCDKFVVK